MKNRNSSLTLLEVEKSKFKAPTALVSGKGLVSPSKSAPHCWNTVFTSGESRREIAKARVKPSFH